MKRMAALLLAAVVLLTPMASAGEETLPEYGLTVETPEGWTLLYREEMDRRQELIEQPGEASKGEPWEMDEESTVFVCFDEAGTTELQLTAVENEFSQDAFQLTRVPKDYKDSFIKGLQDGKESGLLGQTYSKSRYYEHPQAEFIRYEMTWELGERVTPMQKYYTVVNGVSVSVNLFCWDGEKSEADEALAQAMVDSLHWDKLLEPTEDFRGYTSVSLSGAITMILGLFAVCGLIFAAYTYEDWRPTVAAFLKKLFRRKAK